MSKLYYVPEYDVFVAEKDGNGYATPGDLFPELPWHARKGWFQEGPGAKYESFFWIDYNEGKSRAVMLATAVRRLRAIRGTN